MQNESKPITTEGLIQANQGFQEKLDETAKHLQGERSRKTFWKFLAILVVCVSLYEKKTSIAWLPAADSPQMWFVMSDWWGLRVQTIYPAWRQPTGGAEESSPRWCVMYPDNTWRVFYGGGDESAAYMFPPPNYRASF